MASEEMGISEVEGFMMTLTAKSDVMLRWSLYLYEVARAALIYTNDRELVTKGLVCIVLLPRFA